MCMDVTHFEEVSGAFALSVRARSLATPRVPMPFVWNCVIADKAPIRRGTVAAVNFRPSMQVSDRCKIADVRFAIVFAGQVKNLCQEDRKLGRQEAFLSLEVTKTHP